MTLRLDRDEIERFRAGGKGWQSRINAVPRGGGGVVRVSVVRNGAIATTATPRDIKSAILANALARIGRLGQISHVSGTIL